jgi:hypothetical protein
VCVSIFATISGDSDLIFLRASSPSRILLAISFSQRNSLATLSHEGVISEVDAEKLISDVELKMRKAGQSKLS